MKQSETKFKEKVMKELKEAFPDAYVLKTQERGRRGVPDLLCCIRGKFIAMELKTDTGKLAKIQEVTLKNIQKAEGIALVTSPDNWMNVIPMLKYILR